MRLRNIFPICQAVAFFQPLKYSGTQGTWKKNCVATRSLDLSRPCKSIEERTWVWLEVLMRRSRGRAINDCKLPIIKTLPNHATIFVTLFFQIGDNQGCATSSTSVILTPLEGHLRSICPITIHVCTGTDQLVFPYPSDLEPLGKLR